MTKKISRKRTKILGDPSPYSRHMQTNSTIQPVSVDQTFSFSNFQANNGEESSSAQSQAMEIDDLILYCNQISKIKEKMINKILSWKEKQIKNEKQNFKRLMDTWMKQIEQHERTDFNSDHFGRKESFISALKPQAISRPTQELPAIKIQNDIPNIFNKITRVHDQLAEFQSTLNANDIWHEDAIPNTRQRYLSSKQTQQKNHLRVVPRGCILLQQRAIVIWNYQDCLRLQLLEYCSSSTEIKHIIVQHRRIVQSGCIYQLMDNMPWLQGLYIYCSVQMDQSVIAKSKLQYFSYLPSSLFLSYNDRQKYFSRHLNIQRQINKQIDLSSKSYINGKLKNICVYNQENVNFHSKLQEIYNFGKYFYSQIKFKKLPKLSIIFHKLQSLSFNSIYFSKNQNDVKDIIIKFQFLHTLVFQNCKINHSQLITTLLEFPKNQLKHLALVENKLISFISLTINNLKEIAHHVELKTLVLNHVFFHSNKTSSYKTFFQQLKKNYQILANLKQLTHLNFKDTYQVKHLLSCKLNEKTAANIKILNIGGASLSKEEILGLRKFVCLSSLSIQYTTIQSIDFLHITQTKHRRYEWRIIYKNKKENQLSNWNDFKNLFLENASQKPQICKYMQVMQYQDGCEQLSTYQWQSFKHLECIRIKKGLFSKDLINRLNKRNIKVIQEQNPLQTSDEMYKPNNNYLNQSVNQQLEFVQVSEQNQNERCPANKKQKRVNQRR